MKEGCAILFFLLSITSLGATVYRCSGSSSGTAEYLDVPRSGCHKVSMSSYGEYRVHSSKASKSQFTPSYITPTQYDQILPAVQYELDMKRQLILKQELYQESRALLEATKQLSDIDIDMMPHQYRRLSKEKDDHRDNIISLRKELDILGKKRS